MRSNESIALAFDHLRGALELLPDPDTRIEALEAIGQIKANVMDRLTSTDERQAFIDRAAQTALGGLLASDAGDRKFNRQEYFAYAPKVAAEYAYDLAEALWLEREKRRTGGDDG